MTEYDSNLPFSVLKDIILQGSIHVRYQPVLSVRNHLVVGYEGLIRGRTRSKDLVVPIALFDAAGKYGMSVQLDRLCREKVLAGFRKIFSCQKSGMLFLNVETSLLSSQVVGSGYLLDQVEKHGIPPSSIVIEIVESKTADTDALLRFVNAYRSRGFNVALDDVGTGHSNFDRISLIRPSIIKVDRSIISGIETNYYKQEVFKSLSNLSKNIGCLTLAEGVETEEEILCCIKYGADLLQGYFFSKPKRFDPRTTGNIEKKLANILNTFKIQQIDFMKERQKRNQHNQKVIKNIIGNIQGKSLREVKIFLEKIVEKMDTIDTLYVVSDKGIQLTDTVIKDKTEQFINPVFRMSNKNENLSHKEYIYPLIHAGLMKYTTDRYVSFATGKLCVTLSHFFRGAMNRPCILCVDFLALDDQY